MKTGAIERGAIPPVSRAMAPACQDRCRQSGQI